MRFQRNLKLIAPYKDNWYGAQSALYAKDPDANLIMHLMRTENDKLGFIPITQILQKIKTTDCLIWQRDANQNKIGYLIHSPVTYLKPIHIELTVIDIEKRRRKWATRALAQLIKKAYQANAPLIRLRCAHDLEANLFWKTCGFELTAQVPNMRQQPRDINIWTLPREKFQTIRHEIIIPSPFAALKQTPVPY